jgi:hypothetical protein
VELRPDQEALDPDEAINDWEHVTPEAIAVWKAEHGARKRAGAARQRAPKTRSSS